MAQITDKELHFFAGVGISFAASIILHVVDLALKELEKPLTIPYIPLWVFLIVVAGASYREMQGIKWDWKDWINTMAGGLIGFAISFV